MDKAIAILKELQARVENKMNPSPDFLLQIMEVNEAPVVTEGF